MSERSSSHLTRSLLFVPGDRPERFNKALAAGAHQVVIDLEDAVAIANKDAAREATAEWLASGATAAVRINGADTPWFDADLRMLASRPGVQVMLPKADASSVAQMMAGLPGCECIALIETVQGYFDLSQVAAQPAVVRLAFGSIDFATDSGISDEGEAMTAIRTQIILESVRAGLLAPVDGVSVDFTDLAQMQQDAHRSRQLGFGGKLCIHPRQVGEVNAAYQPTPEQIAWARRVIAAIEASNGGVTTLDGRMIDKPVVDQAQQILASE